MSILARFDALNEKHAQLENLLSAEQARPMPDFAVITGLKKRKLRLKEEMEQVELSSPVRVNG